MHTNLALRLTSEKKNFNHLETQRNIIFVIKNYGAEKQDLGPSWLKKSTQNIAYYSTLENLSLKAKNLRKIYTKSNENRFFSKDLVINGAKIW